MREIWIVALVVLYVAVLLGGALLVTQSVSMFTTQLAKQVSNSGSLFPSQATNISINYIPVIHQDNRIYQDANKPYIVTSGLTAQDYRSSLQNSLHISGRLNNTGGGTAYNAVLHVVAMNSEGKAIDSTYSFDGITPHQSVGLGFSLNYTGSALTNCTITPIYTDSMQPRNQTMT
jgi:hypothetical protein